MERITENSLQRTILLVGLIILPSSSGYSQILPITCLVADTFEFFSIHKGLQKIDGVIIDSQPVS
jgi:hypothetical protein